MGGLRLHAMLEGFAFLPINVLHHGPDTYTSQNLGAGEHARAKKGRHGSASCARSRWQS